MWTTGTTQMIARLTGSTLFANHNLVSVFACDQRSVSTTGEKTPSSSSSSINKESNVNVIIKMRELRARSPYALFVKDNFGELKAKHPDLKLGGISKKVAEVWRSLSDDQKQNYMKRFQDQKASYEQEKKNLSSNDLQMIDADEKARRLEHRVKKSMALLPTKRPRSAYAHFLSTLDRGEGDLKDFMKGASQRWSQMTTQDKQRYEDLREEEKQKYAKELVAWASADKQAVKTPVRRSASVTSPKTRDVSAKKTRATSATGKRAVKKRASGSSKSAISTKKSTRTKSTPTTRDKEVSSSSSDDESTPKTKRLSKSTEPNKS